MKLKIFDIVNMIKNAKFMGIERNGIIRDNKFISFNVFLKLIMMN